MIVSDQQLPQGGTLGSYHDCHSELCVVDFSWCRSECFRTPTAKRVTVKSFDFHKVNMAPVAPKLPQQITLVPAPYWLPSNEYALQCVQCCDLGSVDVPSDTC